MGECEELIATLPFFRYKSLRTSDPMSTPVQRQYWELKNQNPDAILFFRLGDFYEMFFEDASLCSRILGIALTARHRGTENEMPMCGFPYHAHEEYLEKLIESGYKVAIAEQIEDPATKKITREIVRIVTPGATMEEGNLKPETNTFLASVGLEKSQFAIAYSDLSTGEFRTALFENEISFFDELYKLNPSEILLEHKLFSDEDFCKKLPSTHLTPRPNMKADKCEEILKTHFDVPSLEVFDIGKISLLIQVSGLLLKYLQDTQKSDLSHISKLIRYLSSDVMGLDRQTFRHLEIFAPLYSEGGATLWSVFEKAFTATGSRTLRMWLANPLLHLQKIQERQELVEEFVKNTSLAQDLGNSFRCVSDLERLIARFVTGRGTPRDAGFLRDSFLVFPDIAAACKSFDHSFIQSQAKLFESFALLSEKLQSALVETPPILLTEGGIFAKGYSEKLDELRGLSHNAKKWLDEFLEKQKAASGISTLRIKYSKNFGFCLEVSSGQKDKVPDSWVRRQTLVNAERFTTPELAEYEEKVLSAESESFALEQELFHELRKEILSSQGQIQQVARVIGELDALLALARTATRWRWTKPEIVDHSTELLIREGRHPVVEKISTERFIANDLEMGESSRFHLLTGPNMAGKSTFLRQNALIILLAQMGSFVPAKSAKVGLCDRIFTRVGASDNLAGGQSTFFVEMIETSRILNAATDRSFIILDEVGRGTSTFDGISLAWAITEFLHNQTKAKTLFATHYHELIDLIQDLSSAANFHIEVSQNKNGIVFLRKVSEGGISDSFGIEVAKSAGLPSSVIKDAKEVLARLESENLLSGKPTLFSAPRVREKIIEKDSGLAQLLESVKEEDLSPKQALDLVFEMKKLLKNKG